VSLIDDALKRAQEARRADSARPEGDPWSPAPLPDAGRSRRRRIRRAAALAGVAAAAAAAGLLLLRRPGPPDVPRERTPGSAPGALAAAAAMPPTPTLPPAVAVAPAAAVPAPVRTQAAAAVSRVPPAAAAPVVAAAATPAPATSSASNRLPAPSSMPVVVRAMPSASGSPEIAEREVPERPTHEHAAASHTAPEKRDTARGEVAVPGGKIELGGIVYSENNPVALLNGHIVGVGAVVEGFTVVAIEENRVELKHEHRTIILALR
jgi:hypothetical protein